MDFRIVHHSSLVPTRETVSLEKLRNNVNECNFYYNEKKIIKTNYYNGKFFILNGHHSFYRGRLCGCDYFLIENKSEQNNLNSVQTLKVYESTPELFDLKYSIKVPSFSRSREDLLKKFIEKVPLSFERLIVNT